VLSIYSAEPKSGQVYAGDQQLDSCRPSDWLATIAGTTDVPALTGPTGGLAGALPTAAIDLYLSGLDQLLAWSTLT